MSSLPALPLPSALLQAIVDAIRVGVENALRDTRRSSSAAQRPPEFLTIRETMTDLAISRSEIYRRFKSRELTLVKRGRRSLVSSAEVSAYAERLRGATPAEQPGHGGK